MILDRLLPLGKKPFGEAKRGRPRKNPEPETADAVLSTSLDPQALAIQQGGTASYIGVLSPKRGAFEESPYDFEQIYKAIDTDSYIKQAFAKYSELFWKSGWEIIGENDAAVGYLLQRIDYFEVAMQRSFEDFLREAVDQLLKFANVFIVESRDPAIKRFFPTPLNGPGDKPPIVGYYLIPTEMVQILRDSYNKPIAYKQSMQQGFATSSDQDEDPIWLADEVVHLYLDRKPGRIFGTPFVVSVLDDVIALRQLEEDIQNLVHRELFPLYKYTVGTPEFPADPEELENAVETIEDMRVDGAIVIPGRHNVDVLGAEGKALDATGYLRQWKERVAVGMGLSPHHMGMLSEGGNRSVTDRLDVALYDKIKLLQKFASEAIRIHIFNPLLLEGGFDPYITPSLDGLSDRCVMRFKEIDVDSQIKIENNAIQKYANSITTLPEARMELNLPAEADEGQLLMTKQNNLAIQQAHAATVTQAAVEPATTQTSKTATGGTSKKVTKPQDPKSIPPPPMSHPGGPNNMPSKPDAAKPSTGGTANLKNNKGPANRARPANQFGRSTSPNVRHNVDDTMLSEIKELFNESDDI